MITHGSSKLRHDRQLGRQRFGGRNDGAQPTASTPDRVGSRPVCGKSRKAIRQQAGSERSEPRAATRRGGRSARPQWRRENDLLLHDHRFACAERGPHISGRSRHHQLTHVPARPTRASVICRRSRRYSTDFTVEDNIRAVLEVVQESRSHRKSILDALLEEFALGEVRNTVAVALSGGERRRVEIARALACNPQFIFLDEPFAGIDPIALSDIRDLVVHLKDTGHRSLDNRSQCA